VLIANITISILNLDLGNLDRKDQRLSLFSYPATSKDNNNNINMASLQEHIAPSPRRSRRVKQQSSLKGMFYDSNSVKSLESIDSKTSVENSATTYSSTDRERLQMVSRKLRQAKRKLLLQSVATPTDSVDQLRDVFLTVKISLDSSNEF
jgi:hypothetical protein